MLLIITIIFLKAAMYRSEPGQCPYLPPVHARHPSCYKTATCTMDLQCNHNEKCCENSCGITLCQKVTPNQETQNLEVCLVDGFASYARNCGRNKTKFCFEGCKRCCLHTTSCNPAPKILKSINECKRDICEKLNCTKQGEVCILGDATSDPYCTCATKCDSTSGDKICARDEDNKVKTFNNKCLMEKEACETKKKLFFIYKGVCKPELTKFKPYEKPIVQTHNSHYKINDYVSVTCFGDVRGHDLHWVQQRLDGTEVRLKRSGGGGDTLSQVILDNVVKQTAKLFIQILGRGGYGQYACKQEFNRTYWERKVYVQPPKDDIFSLSSCSRPPAEGVCDGSFNNFYYDRYDKECKVFKYKGCGGNSNNFQTKQECEMRCKGVRLKNITILPVHYGPKCGDEQCQYYAECVGNNVTKTQQCACANQCSLIPRHVCGSDGKTYVSACVLQSIACRYRKPLFAVHEGRCTQEVKPTKKPNFTLCDLVQCPPYAKCVIHPIAKAPQCICRRRCTLKYELVCATNMKHYINTCFMKLESCNSNRMLTVLKHGLCPFKTQFKKHKQRNIT